MKLFVVDDNNITWDKQMDFFLYGGIVVPEEEIRSLAEQLLNFKAVAKIRKERPIKWSNNKWNGEGPLDEKLHATLKKQILDLVASSKCQIIVCLSPQDFYHDIKIVNEDEFKFKYAIRPENQKRTQEYGLNDAMGKFHLLLEKEDEVGMVIADEFGTSIKEHMDKHCFKIFPEGANVPLKRIVHPVIKLSNEESHLHQINDVVLGAIYFSLREMGFNFLPAIKDSFWMEKKGDYNTIMGKGFNVYPIMPKTHSLKKSKEDLQEKFLRLVTK